MTLEQAITLAAAAHAGQTDKGGEPYILHPLRVMQTVEHDDKTVLTSLRIIAVLHDVFEDNPNFTVESVAEEFGLTDLEKLALSRLTHAKHEPYAAYIARIAPDPLARAVKLADLRDNQRIDRIPLPGAKDVARLRKYGDAERYLLAWRPGL